MDEKPVRNLLFNQNGKKQTLINHRKNSKDQDQHALQFENIFENIPEALIITDRNGRIERINRAAIALLGETKDALDLADWPGRFGFYLNEELEPFPTEKMPVLRALNGDMLESEEMVLRREGEAKSRWISMSARPIIGANGMLEGTSVLLQDITSRKLIQISRETYIRRIETLYRLSHIIAESGNDLKRITHAVAVLTAEVIGDLCSIALLGPGALKFNIPAFYDPDSTARTLFRKVLSVIGTEFDAHKGLQAQVIQSARPLLLSAFRSDELEAVSIPEVREFMKQIGISSLLIVPMIGRSGVLGTLSLMRHQGQKPYTAGDQSFLMDIAYRTALAIENGLLVDSLRTEIADRVSAERALGVSEERFRSIFESTTLGIKILDLGGNILHTNSSFQEMIGYTAGELVGRHFYDFLHPEDISAALKLFQDLKISGLPDFRYEHRAIRKDGSALWIKTTFTGVKKGGGDDSLVFIVGILENITEQKRIEAEMIELNGRLQNAMELERLRLAQELHDGPMQELYNAIYRIEEVRMKVTPQVGIELEHVNQDVQKVLHELRSTAKELRPPTISSFGLEKAIRSHVQDFREKYPDIKVHLSLAQDRQLLPEEIRLALFRILQQSLANVARHAEATDVHVRFSFDAEEAALEIIDNGKGFQVPSTWIDLVREGHYGLAGGAERVNALDGTFSVKSEPGKSTTIYASIPWQERETTRPGFQSEKS
jgi:PAS domain S-box-containing protein